MTHDQQGSAPANEPQGTPSADTTAPSTLSLDKTPATPATTGTTASTTTDAAAPADAPYPPADTTAYPPAGHGQPGYGQPAPARGTDGMSIAALVTGILGLGVVPLVLGILGLKRTKANGTSGRGLSIAGIVLGILSTIGWIVFAITLTIASNAIVDSVNEAGGIEELTEQLEELATPAPEETGATTDDLATSTTPLKDIAPLSAGAFTTAGLTDEATITGAGALEAYSASYTDGASTVETVVSNWTTGDEALAFANAQTAALAPESLIDSGELSELQQYWLYDVDGVSTLVATNDTATLTFTGPADAVTALYNEYPL